MSDVEVDEETVERTKQESHVLGNTELFPLLLHLLPSLGPFARRRPIILNPLRVLKKSDLKFTYIEGEVFQGVHSKV